MAFTRECEGIPESPEWCTKASFYEADIQVDAILGYPWLAERELGVFPHLKALAFGHPKMILLRGRQQGPKTEGRADHLIWSRPRKSTSAEH